MGLRFKVPHTLILLLGMMVVALIATWLVPQGFFTTTLSESGREMVVAGTYQTVAERHYLTPWDLLQAIPRCSRCYFLCVNCWRCISCCTCHRHC